MSAPQPPVRPTTESEQERYQRVMHNLSLGLLIACPILIALPPRKLDLYTFSLMGAFTVSANHMTRERTGKGILEQLPAGKRRRLQPEKPEEAQERLQREGLLRAKPSGQGSERGLVDRVWMGDEKEDWMEKRMREEKEAIAEGKGYGAMIGDQIMEVFTRRKGKGDATGEGQRDRGEAQAPAPGTKTDGER